VLKIRLVLALLVVCLFTFSFVACGGKTGIDFEDTLWYLESYGQTDDMKSVLEHTNISATFDSKDGRVHGNAGCNGYTGSYKLDEGFAVSAISCTELGCTQPEGIMEQEDEYLKILESGNSLTVEDGQLKITGSEGVLIFIKSSGRRPER